MPGESTAVPENKGMMESISESLSNAATYIADKFAPNQDDTSFGQDKERLNDNQEFQESQNKPSDFKQQLNFETQEQYNKKHFEDYLKQQQGPKDEIFERKQVLENQGKHYESMKNYKPNYNSEQQQNDTTTDDNYMRTGGAIVMEDDERLNEANRHPSDQGPVVRDYGENTNDSKLLLRDIQQQRKEEEQGFTKQQKVPIDEERDSEMTKEDKKHNVNTRGQNEESITRHDGLSRD